uniref:Uncharacterized protein n=1 Tax=Lepeophtheirus salmonis TaxID=72036 RepID=A0A0K2V2Q2_LEPSM
MCGYLFIHMHPSQNFPRANSLNYPFHILLRKKSPTTLNQFEKRP